MSASLFERAGGTDGLRRLFTDFYERVFDDAMIGFFFKGKDRARLIEKETELASKLLGADVAYTGRSLPEAHAAHTIFGGQFLRRLQILKDAMEAQGIDPAVRESLVEHTLALRPQITGQLPGECRMPTDPVD